jgi:uncharacterized membrane protein YdjX (TVP38/TMEM64 family)
MQSLKGRDKTRLIIAMCLIALQGAVLVWLCLSGRLGPLLSALWELFRSKDELRVYVESWGNMAPVAFIVLQTLQVVIAPIPGELTGAVGGFIFGAVPTLFYSTAGLTLGSVLAFIAARIMGLPIVKMVVSPETLEKFHFLTERRGAVLALVLFAIPGFPKDILCYILGLSPMGFVTFLIVCTLGRIPGTALLSYTGSAIFEENWVLLGIVCGICAVALGIFYFCRERIDSWLRKLDAQTPRS